MSFFNMIGNMATAANNVLSKKKEAAADAMTTAMATNAAQTAAPCATPESTTAVDVSTPTTNALRRSSVASDMSFDSVSTRLNFDDSEDDGDSDGGDSDNGESNVEALLAAERAQVAALIATITRLHSDRADLLNDNNELERRVTEANNKCRELSKENEALRAHVAAVGASSADGRAAATKAVAAAKDAAAYTRAIATVTEATFTNLPKLAVAEQANTDLSREPCVRVNGEAMPTASDTVSNETVIEILRASVKAALVAAAPGAVEDDEAAEAVQTVMAAASRTQFGGDAFDAVRSMLATPYTPTKRVDMGLDAELMNDSAAHQALRPPAIDITVERQPASGTVRVTVQAEAFNKLVLMSDCTDVAEVKSVVTEVTAFGLGAGRGGATMPISRTLKVTPTMA